MKLTPQERIAWEGALLEFFGNGLWKLDRIEKETGIPRSSLSRFMDGSRGLSIKNLDKLTRLMENTYSIAEKIFNSRKIPEQYFF